MKQAAPTCKNCRYYQALAYSPGSGKCRRYAPQANTRANNNWVTVSYDDWCGDWGQTDEDRAEFMKKLHEDIALKQSP